MLSSPPPAPADLATLRAQALEAGELADAAEAERRLHVLQGLLADLVATPGAGPRGARDPQALATEAVLLATRSRALRVQQRLRDALDLALEAVERAEQSGDADARARAGLAVGQVFFDVGHFEEARRRMARVDEIPDAPASLRLHARMNRASTLRAEGRLDEAASAFDALQPLPRDLSPALAASTLINAASCYHQVDRTQDADQALLEARRALVGLDRPDLEVWADTIGAWVANRARRAAEATALAERALQPGRPGATAATRGSAARALAEVALWRGAPDLRDRAVTTLEAQLADAGAGRLHREQVDLHASLAALHEARGDLARAVQHLRAARELSERVQAGVDQLRLEREALRLELVRMQVEADALRSHQEQLARANEALLVADHARARLLATLAHDLRGPLTSVLALVDLVEPHDPSSVAEGMRTLQAAVDRMLAMLDAALAPQARSGVEPVDLAGVVRAAALAFQGLAARKGQRIEVHAPSAAPVRASRVSLGRLVDNLLSNALKYGPPGGLVRVEVSCRAGRADLVVLDQGPGFPGIDPGEGLLYGHQLSSRATGGEESFGLGLHTVYQLLAELGGILALGNRPEGGARVRITLPSA
ncbi:HAMP domain-containing histidine kinase [Myxococcota bacterium]|nr:HAMP domain-containing histidine kinase [Myxococcota bacterium]